jgi:hypothetical protein
MIAFVCAAVLSTWGQDKPERNIPPWTETSGIVLKDKKATVFECFTGLAKAKHASPVVIYFHWPEDGEGEEALKCAAFEKELQAAGKFAEAIEGFLTFRCDARELKKDLRSKFGVKVPSILFFDVTGRKTMSLTSLSAKKERAVVKKVEKVKKDSDKALARLEEAKKMLPLTDEGVKASKPEVHIFKGGSRPVHRSETYVVYCPGKKHAILVDASCDVNELARFLREKKLTLRLIVISHSHGDHTVTLSAIKNRFRGVQVVSHGRGLRDKQYLRVGYQVLKVFHTPGHWPDCIVLWADSMLLTGDSFDKDEGRNPIRKSLKGTGSYKIYGGHGQWSESF